MLLKNYVMDSSNPRGLSVFTAPLSKNPKSWNIRDRTLRLDDENTNVHYLLTIRSSMVDQFNRVQKKRADDVLKAYKGAMPDYSVRHSGRIYGKDLSPFAPRMTTSRTAKTN